MQNSGSIKIHPVAAKLFHAGGSADRQTDMMKLIVTFSNFVNMLKNEITKQAHYTYMVSLNCLLGKWQIKNPSHCSLAILSVEEKSNQHRILQYFTNIM
jgi:hypothetical protein